MEKLLRVQKYIALSGLCSRRKAEELIIQGKVKVNGETVAIGASCEKTDKIEVEDKLIEFDLENFVYIVMNKSSGYLSTKSDEFDRKTVYDLLDAKDNLPNLFSLIAFMAASPEVIIFCKNLSSIVNCLRNSLTFILDLGALDKNTTFFEFFNNLSTASIAFLLSKTPSCITPHRSITNVS